MISTHPSVAQVAVFGLPDDFYRETVAAWLQLDAGESLKLPEIRMRERMLQEPGD